MKKRVAAFDFIRVCALFLIIVYHLDIASIPGMNAIGPVGVGLYLMLSGAVLMYIYGDNSETCWGVWRGVDFYKRRYLTLMLPFYIAYIIVWLWNRIINVPLTQGVSSWKIVFTMIGMDGFLSYKIPTFYLIGEWFLGCIILYYLAFPTLELLIRQCPLFLILVTSFLFDRMIQNYTWEMPILWNPIVLAPNFVFGMYFTKYLKDKVKINVACLAILGYIWYYLKPPGLATMYILTVSTIFLFLVLFYVGTQINNLCTASIVNKLSKYSYGIILFHHVVFSNLLRYSGKSIQGINHLEKSLLGFCGVTISLGLSILLDKCCVFIKNGMAKYRKQRSNKNDIVE